MLILLPPSEAKTSTAAGPPLALEGLSLPELNPTRVKVMHEVVRLANGQPGRAHRVLGLSKNQGLEVERDRVVASSPTAPAADVYSGVLFDALGYQHLPLTSRRRLDRWVLVSSALWGAVRLRDQIPAYRLSIDVTLPRLGTIVRVWHKPLRQTLPDLAAEGVVFDLRSGGYAKMWTPSAQLAERTVVGRVLQRRPNGSPKVVSHHNKATKGRLLRALSRQAKTPRTASSLASLVGSLGYDVELTRPDSGKPAQLNIVVDEL